MTKELVSNFRDFLESKAIGGKPAHEWIEEQLNSLKEAQKFDPFKIEGWNFEKIKFDQSPNMEFLLGQKEEGEEAVGFVAGFAKGDLMVISVFVDLKDRFIWTRKEGGREKFNQIIFNSS